VNKLIEKLEKLDKDATPKSWELTFMEPEGFPSFFLDKELTKDLTNSDLNLIEETRNALPEIIQALKQGEKMREVLRAVEFQCQTDGSKLIQKTLSECKEKDGHKN